MKQNKKNSQQKPASKTRKKAQRVELSDEIKEHINKTLTWTVEEVGSYIRPDLREKLEAQKIKSGWKGRQRPSDSEE